MTIAELREKINKACREATELHGLNIRFGSYGVAWDYYLRRWKPIVGVTCCCPIGALLLSDASLRTHDFDKFVEGFESPPGYGRDAGDPLFDLGQEFRDKLRKELQHDNRGTTQEAG